MSCPRPSLLQRTLPWRKTARGTPGTRHFLILLRICSFFYLAEAFAALVCSSWSSAGDLFGNVAKP